MILQPIKIVNKKRYTGYGEYIGRPSPLGNPYSHVPSSTLAQYRVATRDEAVYRYCEWLPKQLVGNTSQAREINRLIDLYITESELTLICWCKPKKCHGDSIAETIYNSIKLRYPDIKILDA